MKLIRFGDHGQEKAGVQLDNGARKDVSAIVPDWNEDALADGGIARVRAAIAERGERALPDINAAARTGACVARLHKIIGIGLNYRDHAAESGMPIPSEPIIFLKAASSFSGTNDHIVIPPRIDQDRLGGRTRAGSRDETAAVPHGRGCGRTRDRAPRPAAGDLHRALMP